MDKNLLEKSAIELKKLIIKKEISPVELTKLSLERIQETNSKTNTFKAKPELIKIFCAI